MDQSISIQFDGGLGGAMTGRPWYLVNHLGERLGVYGPQRRCEHNPLLRFKTIDAAERAAKRLCGSRTYELDPAPQLMLQTAHGTFPVAAR